MHPRSARTRTRPATVSRAVALAGSPVAAGVLLAVSVAAFLIARQAVGFSSIDLLVYRIEGLAVRSHLDLYSPLPTPQGLQATYPPFAAIVFVPLSWLPAGWLPVLGLPVNVAMLVVVSWLSWRFATRIADGSRPAVLDGIDARRRWAAVLILAAVALWSEPVFLTLRNGQINLALLALVLWDFDRAGRSRWFGVGLGLAAGLKVTPVILIGYLLLTGRFRAAATAAGTFAATIAVSALVLPDATWTFWSRLVFDSNRIGDVDATGNQSLYGVFARATHTRLASPLEEAVVVALAVAGVACAILACRRLGDAWGVSACAVTGLLVAPIAWSHHWVWIVPIAVLLWHQARAWLVSVVAIFFSQLIWLLPHGASANELAFTPVQTAVSASYAIFGIGFLAATARRALRVGRSPQDLIGEPRTPDPGLTSEPVG